MAVPGAMSAIQVYDVAVVEVRMVSSWRRGAHGAREGQGQNEERERRDNTGARSANLDRETQTYGEAAELTTWEMDPPTLMLTLSRAKGACERTGQPSLAARVLFGAKEGRRPRRKTALTSKEQILRTTTADTHDQQREAGSQRHALVGSSRWSHCGRQKRWGEGGQNESSVEDARGE